MCRKIKEVWWKIKKTPWKIEKMLKLEIIGFFCLVSFFSANICVHKKNISSAQPCDSGTLKIGSKTFCYGKYYKIFFSFSLIKLKSFLQKKRFLIFGKAQNWYHQIILHFSCRHVLSSDSFFVFPRTFLHVPPKSKAHLSLNQIETFAKNRKIIRNWV